MNSDVASRLDDETRQDALPLIDLALIEDLGSLDRDRQLDVTTEAVVPEQVPGSATFVSRQPGILCGVAVCEWVLQRIRRDLQLETLLADGDPLQRGDAIAVLSGNARDILIAERTCLNFMGRLSGISSLTREFVDQVAGTKAQVLDTRKTTPGWRRLEKYAVHCGGGTNHRMGLYDAVLIKDNHLAMMDALSAEPLGEIRLAVERARQWIDRHADRLPQGRNTVLQIEVDRLDQFHLAIELDVDIILLDNMDLPQLRLAVETRDRMGKQILLEASGGVNLQTIGRIAQTGVDRISVGALTHSAVNLDIGLDWQLG